MTTELKDASNKLRVAVIGAGASGITSTKTCLEYGFEPVCFEMSDSVGGLWRFTEKESHSSVYRSTIINSSKEMGSFSDFPLPLDPAEWPTFLHHSKQLQYFNMYVDHFKFRDRIRFNTKVHQVSVLPPSAGSTRVRWQVVSSPTSDPSNTVTEEYDAVMVCIGHHSQPRWPDFPGQDTFKGEKIHSHAYKDQSPFVGKTVLVVGIGNSGVDVAVETCRVAKKTYLSSRSGAYVLNRLGMFGLALDHTQSRFVALHLPRFLLNLFFSTFFNVMSGDLERFGLKPTHGLLSAHPTINGELLGKIATSEVLPRKNVSRFTETGVVFEDDPSVEVQIDSVVFCTGYKMRFPFLPADVTRHIVEDENKLPLYRYVYLPESRMQSIGFIGYIQPLGSIMPIAEMQARWFCQVLSGQTPLPDEAGMKRDIAAKAHEMGLRYKSSPRHTIQVDYVPYVEEIARDIGCAPSVLRTFFWSPKLAMQLLFGPALPQVYRVSGPHAWAGAPKAINDINHTIFDVSLTGKPLPPPPPKPWWLRWPFWFALLVLYLAYRAKKSREMFVVYG